MNDNAQALICEDHAQYRRGLVRALERECGVKSVETEDILHAIRALEQHPEIRLVIADDRLGRGGNGTMLIDAVGRRWPEKSRLLLSAWTDAPMIELGMRDGYSVLDKAHPWPVIVAEVRRLLAA